MKPIFKSVQLQTQFDDKGFVKMKLLTLQQVENLLATYQTVAEEHEKIRIPYITTSHSNNPDLITNVDTVLQKIMAPAINQILENCNLLFGNYLVKMPVTGSETEPHQDITFVDETKYTSVNIWVALQDIDIKNGCMYFLEGSHKLMPTLRPTQHFPWAYENVKEEIKATAKSFTAQAGEAFIFNHAVIHGSFQNTSKVPRIAAVIAAYPSDASLLHYYLPNGVRNKVREYGMTKDAFLNFIKGEPPAKGEFIREIEFDFTQLSKKEFQAKSLKKIKSNSLLSKIRKVF